MLISSCFCHEYKEDVISIHYGVIGAGRQGTAAAYELALNGEASQVTLFDREEITAAAAADKINNLLEKKIAQGRCLDARDQDAVRAALKDINGVLIAVPYMYNLELTHTAVETRTHFTDMGGNEDIVSSQLNMTKKAAQAGITVVPDCGMGPGMTGSLAAYGISQFDKVQDVFIWDGGLPQEPNPPWNFILTFHINGLSNEYYGEATFLREGKVVKIPTFSEMEQIDFPPLGKLEAFVTSGGSSTAVKAYQGKLRTYQNKTLRYPGHYEQFRAFKLLGLYQEKSVSIKGHPVSPRDVFHALIEPQLLPPEKYKDICLIRVLVQGISHDEIFDYTVELIDTADDQTGFTAMEKLTGWHAALMLEMAVQERCKEGVWGVETAVEPADFMEEVKKRGFDIEEKFSPVVIGE